MEAPGALEVTRFPGVIVPVCVLKGVSATPCVRATPCMDEAPRGPETPCVEATPCVSGVVASVPGCASQHAVCGRDPVHGRKDMCE